ncbi:MAG: hypothetical protein DRH08_00010 [Deltaproteobacteria bacterium]|nr:MAG: hypothetical protein DRH08_00010 [Deltaproteobacteria bacterium]
MRYTFSFVAAFAALALLSAPAFAKAPIQHGQAFQVAGWSDGNDGGLEPVGRIHRTGGGITIFVDAPDGTPVFAWGLDDTGVSAMPAAVGYVFSSKVSFFGDNDTVGNLPALSGAAGGLEDAMVLQFDTLDGVGDVDVLGRAVIVVDDSGSYGVVAPTPAGDGPSVNGGYVTGTNGDGVVAAFATGRCNKSKCRLKIITSNGLTITDILDKDETYHVSSEGVLYITCQCD